MRKLILSFIFFNSSSIAFSQVVKGTVLDQQSKAIIEFASIYFSGTFVGTATDENGKFILDISKYILMPLTISAIGYYSVTLTDFLSDEPLIIYLTPKVYEFNEVVISSKSLSQKRKAYLKLLKKEFLGTSYNAKKCEILNENDITFNYDSGTDTLKAFASKPILINNTALGYRITYFLDKFEHHKKSKSTFFIGNIIFNQDATIEETEKQFYQSSRKQTYLGSRMHFIRALWSDDLKSSDFRIYNPEKIELNYNNIVSSDDNNKKFINQAATIKPPTVGLNHTMIPAAISITPTTIIKV